MSRIVVESKSPAWAKVDLRMTRLKNADKSETINFKASLNTPFSRTHDAAFFKCMLEFPK